MKLSVVVSEASEPAGLSSVAESDNRPDVYSAKPSKQEQQEAPYDKDGLGIAESEGIRGQEATSESLLEKGAGDTGTSSKDIPESARDNGQDSLEADLLQEPSDKRFIQGLADKRFIQGLTDKRFLHGLTDKRFIQGLTDKRFMHGLTDKRFIQGLTDKRFLHGLTDKRFVQGLTDKRFLHGLTDKRFIQGLTDKRFMHGLTDKRFMHGLTDKRFMHGLTDKRFMHGLTDKRFMHGLTDKRFMHGLTDKRFMHGFTDKRFMHGLTDKRLSPSFNADGENTLSEKQKSDKRFIVGLQKRGGSSSTDFQNYLDLDSDARDIDDKGFNDLEVDKKFMHGLTKRSDVNTDLLSNNGYVDGFDSLEFDDHEKRFLHGLVSNKRFIKGFAPTYKRFMKGFIPSDKRFMRGFVTNKRFVQGLVPGNKRFIQGLAPTNKRFIEGLVENDKRFIQGMVPNQKRFISGLVTDNKRFMKGFVKRSVNDEPDPEKDSDVTLDKKFMHGLVRKTIDEPLVNNKDKKFVQGLVRKDAEDRNGYFPFDSGVEGDDFSKIIMPDFASGTAKRFMHGLVKKESDGASESPKRFIKGFSMNSKRDFGDEKRFVQGLAKREMEQVDKKFMKGFTKKDISNKEWYSPSARFDDGQETGIDYVSKMAKKFIRGYVKKEGGSKNGFEINKKFMKGLVKKETDNSMDTRLSKKFMKGFIKKETDDFEDSEMEKKFVQGLVGDSKRSETDIQGEQDSDSKSKENLLKDLPDREGYLEGEKISDRDALDNNALSDSYSQNDKRFMKGFTKREVGTSDHRGQRTRRSVLPESNGNGYGDHQLDTWYRAPYLSSALSSPSFSSSSFTVPDKKFIRGLYNRRDEVLDDDSGSGSVDGNVEKRFVQGLVKRFSRDADVDVDSGQDKRFLKGFVPNKRFVVGLSEYFAKRFPYADGFDGVGSGHNEKRFIQGLVQNKRDSVGSSDQDQFETKGGNFNNFSKRFIMGLTKYSSAPVYYNPYVHQYLGKSMPYRNNGYWTSGQGNSLYGVPT
ncbi:hypothetical protein PoB_003472500 [Plakobranchus ocellatus]|uniref:Uncharacterized protein n=1 Tax=Plakobranchus ocellatus TaxID=259542 RepID=A0AAV4AMT7_9GAST|nr:hypothetical protein PoB_003472500 [Plakobranchus ocellatus]